MMEMCNESNIEDRSSYLSNTQEININHDFIDQDFSQDSKDALIKLIEDKLTERLNYIEPKSDKQEKEILELMYTLHWQTFQIDNIKDQLPKPTFIKKPYKPKSTLRTKNDETNMSIQSINSKRSTSTLRKEYGKQVGRNYGAQKVSINIGGEEDDNATAVTTRKNPRDKNTEIKSLEKNLKPKVVINNIKTKNILTKSTKKDLPVKVALSPKESVDIMESNRMDSNKMVNPNYYSLKSNLTNTTSESNHLGKTNYKFEPKKKNMACSGSDGMAQNFLETPFKDKKISVGLTPKYVSNVSPVVVKSLFKNPVNNLFINENNSDIFIKIFECCKSTTEKVKFKNISKQMRRKYFQYEIRNLENIKHYKQAQINPFFNIKITESDDLFNKKLILSENHKKYEQNEQFLNLVKIIYIILTNDTNTNNNKSINEMIAEVESLKNKDKNIYSKYSDIMHNLKTNAEIYNCLKQLWIKNKNLLKLDKLKTIHNIEIILELFYSMKVILENEEPKVDLILDIEIITHKIDTLKTLNSQI
jgi:hypothetical protein